MARELCRGEEQVAEFLARLRRVRRGERGVELGELLAQLVEHTRRAGPVEAHARGPLAELAGPRERGQADGDAVERTAARRAPRARAPSAPPRPSIPAPRCPRASRRTRAGDGARACRRSNRRRRRRRRRPASSAIRAWHTTWNSRSPSSSARARDRPCGSHPRARRPPRSCAARCSPRSARDPRGSRAPDRAAVA